MVFQAVACMGEQESMDRCTVWSIEPFLPGRFEKYLSNDDFTNQLPGDPMHDMMSIFAHWTFHYHKGQALLSDLQGVDGVLTDVIMTDNQ